MIAQQQPAEQATLNQPAESSTTTTGPQAGFSTTDQDLAGYLYQHLIKDFKRYYRCQRLTDQNNKAVTAIFQRFNNQSKADRHDCVTSFIVKNLPVLLEKYPITLESYLQNQNLILTAFKNWLIKQWKHTNVEKKYISHIVDYSDSNGDNMIDNIPDNTEAYDPTIDMLWEKWLAFYKSLSASEKKLTEHWLPTGKNRSYKALGKKLGIPPTTIQCRCERLAQRFIDFCGGSQEVKNYLGAE